MEPDWKPSATINSLKQRAQLIAKIREFFNERGYLEVETPAMSRYGITDVYLANIQAKFRNQWYSLQTSPEYHMKRLLAAGSGPIFQMAKVFRDDELGRWHNPEFTLLEWYQLNIDHHALIEEMDALLQTVLNCPPLVKKTYQQIFMEHCGIDPFNTTVKQLQKTLEHYDLGTVLSSNEEDLDQYLFLLLSHVVEPAMSECSSPIAVYNYPISQAALARVNQGVAERFEIYVRGIELANGFHELRDAKAQADRFQQDLQIRRIKGLPEPKPDHYLLQALKHGLPACSGVALGIDRLMAFALNCPSISETLAFDFSRA